MASRGPFNFMRSLGRASGKQGRKQSKLKTFQRGYTFERDVRRPFGERQRALASEGRGMLRDVYDDETPRDRRGHRQAVAGRNQQLLGRQGNVRAALHDARSDRQKQLRSTTSFKPGGLLPRR
jgi:hypothetical protein